MATMLPIKPRAKRPRPERCWNCSAHADIWLCVDCWRIALISGFGMAAIDWFVKWLVT